MMKSRFDEEEALICLVRLAIAPERFLWSSKKTDLLKPKRSAPCRALARIVRAIETDRRRLVMPWLCHFVPLLLVLPVGVFDRVADFLGVNASMKDFVGRGTAPAADAPRGGQP